MSTISGWNSSNASFYRRQGRRASLLCHPVGLEVLKFYAKLKEEGIHEGLDSSFAEILATKLEPVVRQKETVISSCLLNVINEKWSQAHESSVRGEFAEAVPGSLSQSETAGNPDGVVRMTSSYQEETNQKQVQLIIEVSVDKNGGEKKMEQAFDYASLIKGQSKTALLFTFHVDRNESKSESGRKSDLKITQEAFIYLHSEKEVERKMGFLWREVYEQHDETDLQFLCKSCEGLVRCLYCAGHKNRDAAVICSVVDYPQEWLVVSDNAVIYQDCQDKYVFKVFDNRFYPTHCRPDEWLNKDRPWIAKLCVETEFEFKESSTVDSLGRPTFTSDGKRARNSESPKLSSKSHTAYPRGSVLVIKYKHVKGTHYASQVSHFRDIAFCISEMHAKNTVHGDIRGFNMLHPNHPGNNTEHKGGISNSLLIDFNLSGTPNTDRYPPGYNTNVADNSFDRSGVAGQIMQTDDDWKDLGSVMAHYKISLSAFETIQELRTATEAWVSLWKTPVLECTLLDNFIQAHGDIAIEINYATRVNMENIAVNGTGSPNKRLQQPRGSLTLDQSGE
jgi:hypothetical protein